MEKLQFNTDVNSLYSPISPDVVDISSESENSSQWLPEILPSLTKDFELIQLGVT